MTLYIAHVCLNSKLSPIQKGNSKGRIPRIEHPDFCERGFVDIDPFGYALSEQCWKYCPQCEAKGFPKIDKPEKNQKKSANAKKNYKPIKRIKCEQDLLVKKAD
jgi:hypothetical protein